MKISSISSSRIRSTFQSIPRTARSLNGVRQADGKRHRKVSLASSTPEGITHLSPVDCDAEHTHSMSIERREREAGLNDEPRELIRKVNAPLVASSEDCA